MNERKQVMLALKSLETQFLEQQQQVGAHARHLLAWYRQNRLQLSVWVITAGIGITYATQKLQKRFPVVNAWVKRGRIGLLWLLDVAALNSRTVKGLFNHFILETRRLKS